MSKKPIRRYSSTLALIAPTAALFASSAADAAAYIKFDGVDGEAVSVDHKDWIVVESMNWAIGAPVSSASGGGAGKATFKEFTVTKRVDKSSPLLFLACATGQTNPTVTLSITRMVNGEERVFYTLTLSDVIISSIGSENTPTSAGGGNDRPLETVSFKVYPKVEIQYTPIDDASGIASEPVSSGVIELEAPAVTQ